MEYQNQHSVQEHPAGTSQVLGSTAKGNGRRAPSAEVVPKAKRRRFSAAYKLGILEEVERSPGQTGAILRREGVYSSHLSKWRQDRRDGSLKALAKKKRGPKGKSAAELEVERLRKENARLLRELEKANIVIGAQKKLAAILGIDLPKIAESESESDDGSEQ
jgi:transposase-like protein